MKKFLFGGRFSSEVYGKNVKEKNDQVLFKKYLGSIGC